VISNQWPVVSGTPKNLKTITKTRKDECTKSWPFFVFSHFRAFVVGFVLLFISHPPDHDGEKDVDKMSFAGIFIEICCSRKKSEMLFSVIPAKAGLQVFRAFIECLDPGFHRGKKRG